MRPGVWGPFFSFFFLNIFFLNLAEAAASAASMQFTALPTCSARSYRDDPFSGTIHSEGEEAKSKVVTAVG